MKREAQDRQEELALDMKILEQCLEESRNEFQEKAQRRAQLKDEQRQYREYLKQQVGITVLLRGFMLCNDTYQRGFSVGKPQLVTFLNELF